MAELLNFGDPFPHRGSWAAVRDWFARRLKERPLAEIKLLTARIALRGLPYLHGLIYVPRNHGKLGRPELLLACLRCHSVAASAVFVSTAETDHFGNAVSDAALAADAAAAAAHPASVAVAAASAATAAYVVATQATAEAHIEAAAVAADEAVAANRVASATTAEASGAPAYHGAAFMQDCQILDAGGVERLVRARLWPDWDSEVADAFLPLMPENHRFNPAPKAFRDELALAVPRLRDLPGDFAVWLEWYDGIQQGEKNGRYLFGLPTERALRLNVEIALIDETFWKDPAKVNAEIRRLVEVARGETTRNSKPEPAGTGRSSSGKPTEIEKRQKAKPENRSKRPKPKSEVGKVFLANAATLALQAHLLIALIDEELRQLGDQRPNSQEEIDKKAASIAALEKVKANTIALRDSAVAFPNGEVSEEQVVKKVNAFFKPFRDMWSEKGKELAESSCRTGLFLGAMAIAPYCGVPITAGALILGAITAGKPLAEVLKASKGVFKIT